MKIISILVGVCILISGSAWANSQPNVSNVVVTQRPHTALIDITYDLADSDGDPAHITMWYSLEGDDGWDFQCLTLSGAAGAGVMSGVGLEVTWDAGQDVADITNIPLSVRIYADDGVSEIPAGYVYIPNGTFYLGDIDDISNGYHAFHPVTLTTPFMMSSYEITTQQFVELAQWAYDQGYCTANNTSVIDALDGSLEVLVNLFDDAYDLSQVSFSDGVFSIDPGAGNFPMRGMSWYGAAAYCDWLSLRDGLPRAYDHNTWLCNNHEPYGAEGYRLPTEAEWEFACRAGTTTRYNTGTCLDSATEADYGGGTQEPGCPDNGPHDLLSSAIGSFPANDFGLFDMHGNIGEWVNDSFDYYDLNVAVDPTGPADSNLQRIIRGGYFLSPDLVCSSAYRRNTASSSFHWVFGVRPVKSL